jgi:hypothetical protein
MLSHDRQRFNDTKLVLVRCRTSTSHGRTLQIVQPVRHVVFLNKQALSFVRHGIELGHRCHSMFRVPGSCSPFGIEVRSSGAEFRVSTGEGPLREPRTTNTAP